MPVNSYFSDVFRGCCSVCREGVAVLIHGYFDESSEGSCQDGIFSVSGYVLDRNSAVSLEVDWAAMLNLYRLKFFHMCECNSNSGEFAKNTGEECDLCAREAIRIAKKYPLHGRATVLVKSDYIEILQNEGFDCDPYTFLVWYMFVQMNKWVKESRPESKMTLFFEDGYQAAPQAKSLLRIFKDEGRAGKNCLSAYAFVQKEESLPTQAADLIAWHIRKGYENMKKNRPIRQDTKALFEGNIILTEEFTRDKLMHLRSKFLTSHNNLREASDSLFRP